MKLYSRRTFLGALGAGALAGVASYGYMRYGEAFWFEITEKSVPTSRLGTPLRLLHLSDFHASAVVPYAELERAVDLALGLNADLAFLTGDFITWHLEDADQYRGILARLSANMPVYACVGNHDGGAWAGRSHGYADYLKVAGLLEASGVRLLVNQADVITLQEQTLRVVGLGDLWSGDCHPGKALRQERERDEAVLVLSHNPDSKALLEPYDWDLVCCGHTHGGQLVVPVLGLRPFLPVRDKSLAEGLRQWGSGYIHVTRGVGNLHGMRMNCRPEISVLNLS